MYQALIDFLLLTIVLWAAGGLGSPFISYYVFHVALVGILSGPRATLLAGGFALACAGLLWLTEAVPVLRIGALAPAGVWDPLASVVAFVSTVGAIAYLVTHAVAELRDRERALQEARDRAELEYELLSNTLERARRRPRGARRQARRGLAQPPRAPARDRGSTAAQAWHCPAPARPCERDASGAVPDRALVRARRSRPLPLRGRRTSTAERVYELLSFPLSRRPGEHPRVMNLYVDRTSATLAERQLVLAERLASLGRVAQGVAHELNTPLATIRTLAADMVAALRSLDSDRRSRRARGSRATWPSRRR